MCSEFMAVSFRLAFECMNSLTIYILYLYPVTSLHTLPRLVSLRLVRKVFIPSAANTFFHLCDTGLALLRMSVLASLQLCKLVIKLSCYLFERNPSHIPDSRSVLSLYEIEFSLLYPIT